MSLTAARHTVLCFDDDRLGIVQLKVSPARTRVVGGLVAHRPLSVQPDDPHTLGLWLRDVLDKSGLPRQHRVTLVVPRRELGLKVLELPGQPLDTGDMVGMVRLRIERQVAFDTTDAAIDYAELDRDERGVRVLAAAMPRHRLETLRHIAKSARLTIEAIVPRPMTIAALFDAAHQHDTLAIIPGSGEFVIVRAAQPVYTHAPTPAPQTVPPDPDGQAGWLALQAKRTLMSYRVALGGDQPSVARLIGANADSDAAELVEQQTGLIPEPMLSVDGVTGIDRLPRDQLPELLPLVGVARLPDPPANIDLLNPKRPPDRRAPVRQAVLLGLFIIIAIIGTLWVLGSRQTQQLDRQIDAARDARDQARTAYIASIARDARTQHARSWAAAQYDWLAHLEAVADKLPGPDHAEIDRFDADMRADTRFVKGTTSSYPGTWSQDSSATIRVRGRVTQRRHALALRQQLVDGETYRVILRGPDTDDSFGLELLTRELHPGDAP